MGTLGLWIGFNVFVLLMLAVDLGVFHRRARAISLREAAAWSVVWVAVSLGFNLGLLHWYGKTPALEFFTGYVIEKSLSVDNLFVFVLLFRYFAVEPRYQHRVLFWGILGALLMRGALIGVGVALIRHFEWVLYLFGAFLVYAGAKMMFHEEEEVHPERNPVFRWARKFLPLTKSYEGQKFFVRARGGAEASAGQKAGRWLATPLVLVLLVVETTDLAFALDSIPAIFAITRDPFIVYTSNVCAILGLRAFYFLLAGVLPYFRYLGKGLSVVLLFIGVKMLGEHWLRIPTHVSLAVVGIVLLVAVVASILKAHSERVPQKRTPAHSGSLEAKRAEYEAIVFGVRIRLLAGPDLATRREAAHMLYGQGFELALPILNRWLSDPELAALLLYKQPMPTEERARFRLAEVTVGLAVTPENFERIREANGSPRLADVPPDQDAKEFELHFGGSVSLDILTTRAPGGAGAIARFLEKFGEGIQQVEYLTTDVDRATQLLRERLSQQPIYPQTRPGADGTRVNFFLASTPEGQKVLIELVEVPQRDSSP
jgi:tellurite resistance protein TerC